MEKTRSPQGSPYKGAPTRLTSGVLAQMPQAGESEVTGSKYWMMKTVENHLSSAVIPQTWGRIRASPDTHKLRGCTTRPGLREMGAGACRKEPTQGHDTELRRERRKKHKRGKQTTCYGAANASAKKPKEKPRNKWRWKWTTTANPWMQQRRN